MCEKKPIIYRWAESERELAHVCTVQEVLITELTGETGNRQVKGSITCCDYTKGVVFTDHWTAGESENGWVVKPLNEDGGYFFTDQRTGESVFTLSSEINVAISACINTHIGYYLRDGVSEVIAARYNGEMQPYVGLCRCEEIENFGANSPLELWRELMERRDFPSLCFQCSCGTRWWFNDQTEVFCPVPDDDAWQDLVTHDGRFTRLSVETNSGICLMMTMRQSGWIPI